MGHARCIVGVDEGEARRRLAKAVIAHDLSVRALEGIVRRERGSRGRERATPGERAPRSAHLRDLEESLSAATGTKVAIQEGRRKGTGRLVIDYYSLDDFDRIASLLGLPGEK
jgi:ParB family chromosome partitioning protein